jgi:hypothetical protein
MMTALINKDHLTNSEVASYLRKAQCGVMFGSHDVCCEISDVDQGRGNEIHENDGKQFTTHFYTESV